MIRVVLQAVYDTLRSAQIAGLKTLYEPGKPAGPFSGSLPAAVIVTGDGGERREYPASDVVDRTLQIDVHVFTRDPLERAEQRSRGSYETLLRLLEALASALESDPTLDTLVDGLEGLEITDTGPGHGRVRATYSVRGG